MDLHVVCWQTLALYDAAGGGEELRRSVAVWRYECRRMYVVHRLGWFLTRRYHTLR